MEEDPKTYELEKPGGLFVAVWVSVVLVILGFTAKRVLGRQELLRQEGTELEQQNQSGRRVLVEPVLHSARTRTIELPGTIHGYIETPVYAKIAGYLKTISVDKGDRVRQGQLVALLDSPELDHQVSNARASYILARLTDHRNQSLLRANVISQQTADESHTQMIEAKAALAQLIATQAYEEIRAPFSGIVTARYVDPGALIPQQTSPAATPAPLIGLAMISELRIYADMPQAFAPFIRDGDPAVINITEYPGRVFKGTVTRHPGALTSATRTMLVEVDISNRDQALLPGMYAILKFEVTMPQGVAMVPDDALVFRDGKAFVPVVRNDRLKLAEVTLGYDDGINVEVTGGVSEQDVVAINVGQAARDGERVRPITGEEAH
jgi:membrane fusion protein, multidrug efflux system